jgi:xanthine dehydrogenase YagR molybdenum-binding subunit
MTTAYIGQPVSRVDGRQKVTGAATYAAEFDVPGLAHGAVVRSTVANGRIASVDTSEAERAPGVIAVVTHHNAPRLAYRPHKSFVDADVGERRHVLQDDRVTTGLRCPRHATLGQAVHAVALVRSATQPNPPSPLAPSARPADRRSAGNAAWRGIPASPRGGRGQGRRTM